MSQIEYTLPQRLNGSEAACVPQSDRILQAVAEAFDTTPAVLRGPRRGQGIALARFAAVGLLVELCPHLSLPAIGRVVGGRDHSTILYAMKRIAAIKSDPSQVEWRRKYQAALAALAN